MVLRTVGTIVSARAPDARPAGRPAAVTERAPRLQRVLGVLLVVQTVHATEHVAQFIQRYGFGEQFPQGLVGRWVNFEYLHLAMNGTVGLLLLAVFFGYRMHDSWWRRAVPRAWWSFVAATAIEDG